MKSGQRRYIIEIFLFLIVLALIRFMFVKDTYSLGISLIVIIIILGIMYFYFKFNLDYRKFLSYLNFMGLVGVCLIMVGAGLSVLIILGIPRFTPFWVINIGIFLVGILLTLSNYVSRRKYK